MFLEANCTMYCLVEGSCSLDPHVLYFLKHRKLGLIASIKKTIASAHSPDCPASIVLDKH
jgi:hypothetical protein